MAKNATIGMTIVIATAPVEVLDEFPKVDVPFPPTPPTPDPVPVTPDIVVPDPPDPVTVTPDNVPVDAEPD